MLIWYLCGSLFTYIHVTCSLFLFVKWLYNELRGWFSFFLFLLPPSKKFHSFLRQILGLRQIGSIPIWPWTKLEKAQNYVKSNLWPNWEILRTIDLKNWPNWNYLNTAWMILHLRFIDRNILWHFHSFIMLPSMN